MKLEGLRMLRMREPPPLIRWVGGGLKPVRVSSSQKVAAET